LNFETGRALLASPPCGPLIPSPFPFFWEIPFLLPQQGHRVETSFPFFPRRGDLLHKLEQTYPPLPPIKWSFLPKMRTAALISSLFLSSNPTIFFFFCNSDCLFPFFSSNTQTIKTSPPPPPPLSTVASLCVLKLVPSDYSSWWSSFLFPCLGDAFFFFFFPLIPFPPFLRARKEISSFFSSAQRLFLFFSIDAGLFSSVFSPL